MNEPLNAKTVPSSPALMQPLLPIGRPESEIHGCLCMPGVVFNGAAA